MAQVKLSPAQLLMLLHYYYSPEPYDRVDRNTLDWFLQDGVLECRGNDYRVTAKGNAWIDMILSTPMPVNRWLDPRDKV